MANLINAQTAGYCYIDVDCNHEREALATAAAFVYGTDSRYGFSSNDLRRLGGSELARIADLITIDHEWSTRWNAILSLSTTPSNKTDMNLPDQSRRIRPPCGGNRIVVRLLWDVAPLACENFATLCANGGGTIPSTTTPGAESTGVKRGNKTPQPAPIGESGKPLTYRKSIIHRVIPKFVVQGGDFVFGNGSGGESIYGGKKFKDERAGLNLKHDRRGVLSMGNSGKNSNTSQFFITLASAPQCDGKHVIFGHVISGWDVLDAIERWGTGTGEPGCTISITDCGILIPLQTPAAGFWYDQPDPQSFSGVSSIFMVRPRVATVVPNVTVGHKFRSLIEGNCIVSVVASMDMKDQDDDTTDSNSSDIVDSICRQIKEWLERFEVDLVVMAPACHPRIVLGRIVLPKLWLDAGIPKDQIILAAKPTDVLEMIQSYSWVARQQQGQQQSSWRLDQMAP